MELIIPNKDYYNSYLSAIDEYRDNGVNTYDFLETDKYDIFERIEDFRLGRNLPEGYVKGTYLWLVDDGEFIGEVSIRHSLTDSLMRFGGNIGYGIRYSKWNKGIGTEMLSMALDYAREVIGLNKVLITCNDDNMASARVIEKNGGILWDKVINVFDGVERLTRRYWIKMHNPELRDNEIHLEMYDFQNAIEETDNPPAYLFYIKRNDDDTVVGRCSFRVGGNHNRHIRYGGNIGYDVDECNRGNKYSLKACRLLLNLALFHKLKTIYIACAPENNASRRICELLGANLTEIVDLPEDDYNYIHHGTRKHCIYKLPVK